MRVHLPAGGASQESALSSARDVSLMQRRRRKKEDDGGVGSTGLSQISQENNCLFDSVSHQHKHDDSSPQLEHGGAGGGSGASCSSAESSDIMLPRVFVCCLIHR